MPNNFLHKTAFRFYDLSWRAILPWLKFNHRLAEGYHQRRLKDDLPDEADLWIQAASVGESFLALEIVKTLVKEEVGEIIVSEPNIASHDEFELRSCEEVVREADIILVLVDHKEYRDLRKLELNEKVLIDTRGIFQ